MAKYNILEAKSFVATYYKGAGSGKWFTLSDYANKADFEKACFEYHNDERQPELMFQHSGDVPQSMASESHISEHFWTLLEAAKSIEEKDELEAFNAWINIEEYEIEYFIQKGLNPHDIFYSRWQGKHENLEHFYIDFLTDNGFFNEIKNEKRKATIINNFDFAGYAQDEEINTHVQFGEGHVFLKTAFYNEK